MTEPRERVRFDKWLWAARFYKTRTLAAQAIDAGQARVDDERVKPAHAVRVGERVTVRKAGPRVGCRGDRAVRPARVGARRPRCCTASRPRASRRARRRSRSARRRSQRQAALHRPADEARPAQARGLPERAVEAVPDGRTASCDRQHSRMFARSSKKLGLSVAAEDQPREQSAASDQAERVPDEAAGERPASARRHASHCTRPARAR